MEGAGGNVCAHRHGQPGQHRDARRLQLMPHSLTVSGLHALEYLKQNHNIATTQTAHREGSQPEPLRPRGGGRVQLQLELSLSGTA